MQITTIKVVRTARKMFLFHIVEDVMPERWFAMNLGFFTYRFSRPSGWSPYIQLGSLSWFYFFLFSLTYLWILTFSLANLIITKSNAYMLIVCMFFNATVFQASCSFNPHDNVSNWWENWVLNILHYGHCHTNSKGKNHVLDPELFEPSLLKTICD